MTQIEIEVVAMITRGEIYINSVCIFPSAFLNHIYQYRKLVFFVLLLELGCKASRR